MRQVQRVTQVQPERQDLPGQLELRVPQDKLAPLVRLGLLEDRLHHGVLHDGHDLDKR